MSAVALGAVLIGGFLGGIARFFLSGLIGKRFGETFPWGTLIVNLSGALAIGAVTGLAQASGGIFADDTVRLFTVTGILGGYTTVSSFSLQTLNLALGGETKRALVNVIVSSIGCVFAVAIGFEAMLRIMGAGR